MIPPSGNALQGLEQRGPAPLLPLGFLLIEAQNVTTPALAPATIGPENDLLGAQVGGDLGIAAGMGQHLVPDLALGVRGPHSPAW